VLPIFLPDKTPTRVDNKVVVFGFVAFDFYAKGGAEVISAFRKVLLDDPTAHLYVVGQIPNEFALEPQVTFFGSKDRTFILNELLPSIDVFVYPTHQDCFSYVMLEAMRAGCAVCTSDYVSMPEAVDYGNAGLISPVGDVEILASNMIEMLNTDTRRKYQAAARLQFLEKFDSAVVLAKLYKIYNDLTSHTNNSNRNTE
jgi:glycosyltransferase involved in cell wall biosynthesis